MNADEQVTRVLLQFSNGDSRAAQILWERYFHRMVQLARRKLEGLPCRVADEEDVALSAMNSFCRGMAEGRFDQLHNSDELWKLLVTITVRKSYAAWRRHHTQGRGGGRVRGESVFIRGDSFEGDDGIAAVMGREPTPELAETWAEDCRRLLDQLGDAMLQQIALDTLQGYTTSEIAEKLGCARRTVERKLALIRTKWSSECVTAETPEA